MTTRAAVAYTATPGHLFQTLLSAVQARAHGAAEVHLVALADAGEAPGELAAMSAVAEAHDVTFHRRDRTLLGGLHPMYGRLFLDQALPGHLDRVLYLDGDTQVRGDLTPLLERPLAPGRVAAVRDPMVAIRRAHAGFRRQIDRNWDDAGIPRGARPGYVNSGVLLFHRSDLAGIRERVLRVRAERGERFTYADQDAINLECWSLIDHAELEWNYPGFLLGVDLPARDDARIVHFMSSPRPWQGGYRPWGRAGFEPYAGLVGRHPELEPYWDRPPARRALRNRAQQGWKSSTEGRTWRSAAFRDAMLTVYPDRVADGVVQPG